MLAPSSSALDRPSTALPTRDDLPAESEVDWLILGGGPHGCHLAARIVEDPDFEGASVRILDRHPDPLLEWKRVTANVGMEFLRSPVVHHVGGAAAELSRFGDRTGFGRSGRHFLGPQRRPSLALFNAHAEAVLRRIDGAGRWVCGTVQRISRASGAGWRVEHSNGVIRARQVILAIGSGDVPRWPSWARELERRTGPTRVVHVLDPRAGLFDPAHAIGDARPDIVVGGGMSGAQLALRRVREGRPVVLLVRDALRTARYDTEPGWLGPRYMKGFAKVSDPDERRATIRDARLRGTVTPEIAQAVRSEERAGRLRVRVGRVLGAASDGDGALLTLQAGAPERGSDSPPQLLRVARVFLATGFAERRPGGRWLDELTEVEGLPVARCGFPVPLPSLRWTDGLFVTGALGELELGPVARNLSGARAAAERILLGAKRPHRPRL